MRRRHARQEEDAAIDSACSVLFCRLIFIVTATFVKKGIGVTRPDAETAVK